ncbi:hypothetical protein BKA81DRAFT_24143 [Phyllosticta paracitricarpa]
MTGARKRDLPCPFPCLVQYTTPRLDSGIQALTQRFLVTSGLSPIDSKNAPSSQQSRSWLYPCPEQVRGGEKKPIMGRARLPPSTRTQCKEKLDKPSYGGNQFNHDSSTLAFFASSAAASSISASSFFLFDPVDVAASIFAVLLSPLAASAAGFLRLIRPEMSLAPLSLPSSSFRSCSEDWPSNSLSTPAMGLLASGAPAGLLGALREMAGARSSASWSCVSCFCSHLQRARAQGVLTRSSMSVTISLTSSMRWRRSAAFSGSALGSSASVLVMRNLQEAMAFSISAAASARMSSSTLASLGFTFPPV